MHYCAMVWESLLGFKLLNIFRWKLITGVGCGTYPPIGKSPMNSFPQFGNCISCFATLGVSSSEWSLNSVLIIGFNLNGVRFLRLEGGVLRWVSCSLWVILKTFIFKNVHSHFYNCVCEFASFCWQNWTPFT